jgi:NAD(P)-dependent dehydrogenase (short-subunit alcohol dehydrogenase family)
MGICDGRVVIITGAGRGLGRAHALEFAAEGAAVVVNDLGVERDGTGGGASGPAHEVVEEITAMGGQAIANGADVADWGQVEGLVAQTLEAFGKIDTLVCNAGFLRDRMLVNMSEAEWDAIMRVHLKGHFVPSRLVMGWWRDQHKAGNPVAGRLINTSSGAGLLGSIGQGNYATAKAGIAALTVQQGAEFGRYGVLSNAIAPDARTRMTEGVFDDMAAPGEGSFDVKDPANASPLVVWLGSDACDVTGRVFEIVGGKVNVCDGWQHGHAVDIGRKFKAAEIGDAVHESIANTQAPGPVYGA